MTKQHAISLLCAGLCIIHMSAQSVKQRFIDAPMEVLPAVAQSTRLDMIDYFESGSTRPSQSFFNDPVRITELTPISITTKTSPVSELTLCIPDTTSSYTIVIESVNIPQTDSRVKIYDTEWNLIDSRDAGLLADWITPEGKKLKKLPEIENIFEFATAHALYNPDSRTVEFTPTLHSDEQEENHSALQYILPSRTFMVTVKGMKEIK